jgi:ankyrin repeat protein
VDPNCITADIESARRSPFYVSCRNGHVKIAEYLLTRKADLNIRSQINGYTPISVAAEKEHLDVVRFLVQAGAETNTAIQTGETALTFAAQKGNLGMVTVLINGGANPNLTDNKSWTPLQHAELAGCVEVANFLKPLTKVYVVFFVFKICWLSFDFLQKCSNVPQKQPQTQSVEKQLQNMDAKLNQVLEMQTKLQSLQAEKIALEMQLKQKDRQIKELEIQTRCGICMEKNRDTVLMPCLHFLYCNSCITGQIKFCPTCRMSINGTVHCRLQSY